VLMQVIVIGGGDTGSRLPSPTSIRHAATSIINLELMDRPPQEKGRQQPLASGRSGEQICQ